ncbi:MAG: hypothetical protein WD380_08100, partial [Gaiellaceae bacterium]
MDQHRDLSFEKAEGLGGGPVEDARDPLKLDEVVARAGRTELPRSALVRPAGDGRRIGPGETPERLRAVEVVLPADATGDERAWSVAQDGVEIGLPKRLSHVLSRAGRDRTRELVHERLPAAAELGLRDRKRKEAHPAVDVVSDAAGRDDPVGELHRSDASDREAVALVDIRHRQRCLDDARKRRDVLELLERPVPDDRLEQLAIGEHSRRHAHVRSRGCRDLPEVLVDPDQLRSRLQCRARHACIHRKPAMGQPRR